jgi:AcrR family transcriptional regulator
MWDRLKQQAMRDIQAVALNLFDEYGYANVTVDRIATTAGVSASSVYRYFGTKEMLVLWDNYDPQILEMLRASAGETSTVDELLAAVEWAIPLLTVAILSGDHTQIVRRMRLITAEPDLVAGYLAMMRQLEQQLLEVLLERLGDNAAELDVRLATAQMVWGFVAALDYWIKADMTEALDKILSYALERTVRGLRAQFGS